MPRMCFVISNPDDFDDWPKLRITVQVIQLFRLVQSPILPSKTDVKIGTRLQACNLQTKEQQTNQRVHRNMYRQDICGTSGQCTSVRLRRAMERNDLQA